MKATIQHCLEMGYCAFGVRRWFSAYSDRGLTLREFCKNGVDTEWLRAQNDPRLTKLADYVESKSGG